LSLPLLLKDPLSQLASELTPETVHRLLPLSIPLNVPPDQLYIAAIRSVLEPQPSAAFATVKPMFAKLRDLPLAIAAAEKAAEAWPVTHPDHAEALLMATALADKWRQQTASLTTAEVAPGAMPTVRSAMPAVNRHAVRGLMDRAMSAQCIR